MNREIKRFTLGPVNTNCYVLINKDTKECLVFDPGDKPDTFVKFFELEGYTIKGVLLTHGHFDHIGGVEALVKVYDAPVYAMEAERQLLSDKALNLSLSMGPDVTIEKFQGLEDGQEIELVGFKIKAIGTPGHTSGGTCYYVEDESIMFTGDTLFAGCVGRVDFPTGNGPTLLRSIREKLFVLPEDTIVYPGHMDATTIGHEKQHNPLV